MDNSNRANFRYALWANSIEPTIMQRMLEATNNAHVISFALGLPDPEFFPISEYSKSALDVLHSCPKALQYAPPISSLKQNIIKLMASRNVTCKESQIFLTSGAQQGINLISRLLLDKESSIITECLTYPGFFQITFPHTPNIITIPINVETGICIDSLERVLKGATKKPAFIYVIPDGHNPLGTSMNPILKEKLVELAQSYQVPIIEDDSYGFLSYDNNTTIPLRGYNENWVIYVGTFSKVLTPSLRIGWLVVPEELIPKLSFIKEATDINTTTFTQRILDNYLNKGLFGNHLISIQEVYKDRRDTMFAAIMQYFPEKVKVFKPTHGFFIWVELPPSLNSLDLFYKALNENIAFMPGNAFACNTEQRNLPNGIRLNFSHCNTSLIELGISKLGNIIKRELANNNC